jgi:hypothetical protein
MSKTETPTLTERLAAALADSTRVKPPDPADNPYGAHDLKSMRMQTGVFGQHLHPAVNMAEKAPGEISHDMEAARFAGMDEHRQDKSAKRMATARARAARKAQFDAIANTPDPPDRRRMEQSWRVVLPLHEIVTRIAASKKRWAERFLGSNVDDVAQIALEQVALVLAKSDKDMDLLARAADELGGMAKRTGRVPGDQVSDDERRERKELARARKWLMGLVNNRVMGALVDTFTSQRNLRWANIDMIATVMASISGVGDDPMTARFKADRAPSFIGKSFPHPGRIDPVLLSAAVAAAITERGLDRMAEILLDEDNRRTDGAVKWTKCSEALFLATPEHGEWMWRAVCESTEASAHRRKARAEAARKHVRDQFEFLPGVVVDMVRAFEWRPFARGFVDGRQQATMSSEFEMFYLGEPDMERRSLRPMLRFASPEEAARCLVEHFAALVTGQDMVESVVYG